MIQGAQLAAMLPHQGAMVLLDAVVSWDETTLRCRSRSHLDPGNPLRHDDRLAAICGLEYGLQAAALHGAMLAGGVPQRAGYVARLHDAVFHIDRLDDPALGTIDIEAIRERVETGGLLYSFALSDVMGRPVLAARATIALPPK